MQRSQYIFAQEFGARFRSKRDCYRILTVEGNAYLPVANVITLYFMKDLISGKRQVSYMNRFLDVIKFIKGSKVKHCIVPQYETVSVEVMMEFA